MSLEELFCDVDDFCRLFLSAWHRHLLSGGTRKRRRTSRLTLGEIMTILIYFQPSQYRNFKAFYRLHLCQHCRDEFPKLLSYNRFMALIPIALMPLCIYLHTRRGEDRDCLHRRDLLGGLPQPPYPRPQSFQKSGTPGQNLHGLVLRLHAPSCR